MALHTHTAFPLKQFLSFYFRPTLLFLSFTKKGWHNEGNNTGQDQYASFVEEKQKQYEKVNYGSGKVICYKINHLTKFIFQS